MEALVTRPAVSCCRRAVASGAAPTRLFLSPAPTGTRQKSTTARTKRALNIPPHPSFLHRPDPATRPTSDQIIFNPPSSAPSVYHTPFIFLPKSDPRRRANLTSELFAASTAAAANGATPPSSSSSSSSSSPSPSSTDPSIATTTVTTTAPAAPSPEDFPTVNGIPPAKPRHHLSKAEIEEMRRLRLEDPVQNSVVSLARRFQCSKLFVMMCCQTPREHHERVRAELEQVKARWGPRRRAAREERHRRLAMLFNGEI